MMYDELINYLNSDNGLFLAVAMLGMLGHAIKKYLTHKLRGSIIDYIFFNNPKRSALAVLTTISSSLGIILMGQLPTQLGAFLIMAFTTGYTADSTVNSDEK